MLMHIPKIFTAEFLKLIMEMGHGEEIIICDANFPYKSYQTDTVVLAGCSVREILTELLHFFPLDQTVECAAVCMEVSRENGLLDQYCSLVTAADTPSNVQTVPRFDFYERAKLAVGIVVTSDLGRGANIIIKKGVVNS